MTTTPPLATVTPITARPAAAEHPPTAVRPPSSAPTTDPPGPDAPPAARRPVPVREVVVVAVRGGPAAWERTSAYVTRAGQATGGAPRVAFYSDKQVHPPVPAVREVVGGVAFTEEEVARLRATADERDRRVALAVGDALGREGHRWESVDVVLLSGPGEEDTLDCGGVAHAGVLGWCRSRRYVGLVALQAAQTTVDLTQVRSSA